jgi:hypothetical protein
MTMTMKKIYKTLAVLVFLLVGACNLDGDLENPNQIGVSGADVNLIMNAVQLDFGDFAYTASATVDPLMRMNAMTGGYRYQTANQPQGNDGIWFQAYSTVLINAETLIPLAKAKGLTTHVAAAELMEAYVWMALVDIFGDVPGTEALQGAAAKFNPIADGGATVYQHALDLINDARTNLALTGSAAGGALARDVYYGGSRANWTAFANTLELKMQMNLAQDPAQAAAANARIAVLLNGTTNIIDTEAENFTYKYGTATVPDSRHPWYNGYYTPTKGAAGGYLANYFLYNAFGIWDTNNPFDFTFTVQDPRWRYYFYRQVGSTAQMYAVDPKAVGCTPTAPPPHYLAKNEIFCIFDPGFYGRDHGDASGTPPSGPVVTCYGIYPAGGKLDNASTSNATFTSSTIRGDGANGAGVVPIWMSWYTNFVRAEFLARSGNTAGAQTEMQNGISNSITQIRNFVTAKGFTLTATNVPSTAAYKTAVDGLYTAAAVKLDVIGKEYYKALWGNGLEAYNLYRRTSAPRNMQATLQVNPGVWLRTQVYPSVYVNLNQNAKQKDAQAVVKTFWDKNPDTLN